MKVCVKLAYKEKVGRKKSVGVLVELPEKA